MLSLVLAAVLFLFLTYQWGRLLLPGGKITLGWWGQALVIGLLLLAGLGWIKASAGFYPPSPLPHLLGWLALGLAAYYMRFYAQFPAFFSLPWQHPLLWGTLALALLPFILLARGWPTGDVLQSIFWAEQIKQTSALPDYSLALTYNRDPSDFRTPLLHTLTAEITSAAGGGIKTSAYFAWGGALTLILLAAAWGEKIGGEKAGIWSFFYALSLPAILRYVTAPGYHYQNLIGELFLWAGFLWLASYKQRNFPKRLLVPAGAAFLALPFTHQLSALFAVLLALPLAGRYLLLRLPSLLRTPLKLGGLLAGAILLSWAALQTAPGKLLLEKLPVLFSAQPHLASQVPSAQGFFQTIGAAALWFALLGFAVGKNSPAQRQHRNLAVLALLLASSLAFAPRFGIDLPPVRCLLYSALPLAALAGAGGCAIFLRLRPLPFAYRNLGITLLLLPLLLAYPASWRRVDLGQPANSTLTPALWSAVSWLQEKQQDQTPPHTRLLIDDPASRRLSWLLLSPFPTPARLGTGVGRRGAEAGQNSLRQAIYLRLLTYEKIFALGADPASLSLWRKEGIGLAATTPHSPAAEKFRRNPFLQAVFENKEVIIFAPRFRAIEAASTFPFPLTRPSLLVNQLRSRGDLYRQQPASLRTTRLAQTEFPGLAALSPAVQLNFNIRDYTLPLWPLAKGEDKTWLLQKPVHVLVRVYGNGAKWHYANNTFQLPDDGKLHTFRLSVPAGAPLTPDGQLQLTITRDPRAPLVFDTAAAWPAEAKEK